MNSILTSILKDEHATILRLLSEMLTEDLNSDERSLNFSIVKFTLTEHLKKEDKYLYPCLRQLDNELLGKEFADEMSKISKQIGAFFEKYRHDSRGMGFSKDLGILLACLKTRILKEEERLFPRFEKLIKDK